MNVNDRDSDMEDDDNRYPSQPKVIKGLHDDSNSSDASEDENNYSGDQDDVEEAKSNGDDDGEESG